MAAILSDQIDRLTNRTRSIKATAAQIAPVHSNSRLFTHAVLYAQLGDLMRDVDSTELGLFTLQTPSTTKLEPQQAHVKRINFVGATPLRRNPHRREDPGDPELYAKAALKCLHKYQDIRPMPRAQSQLAGIINELERTRKSIGKLHSSMPKQQPSATENAPKRSQLKEEEERITALRARMEYLNQRKKELAISKPAKANPAKEVKTAREPLPPSSPEDKFWATPGEASRTLKFAPNSLLDEQVEFNDLDDSSFSMPTPRKEPPSAPFSRFAAMEEIVPEDAHVAEEDVAQSPIESLEEPADPPIEAHNEATAIETEAGSPTTPTGPEVPTPGDGPEPRVRVTHEVERIAAKIHTVYADVIQLSNSPSAKEIVSRLKDVSNQSPTPESPSHSSLSNATGAHGLTAQQVLIAFVFYQLLSSPGYCMSMNGLKDALSAKITSSGLSVSTLGQNPTRIIYGCLAKRMLKIDRTGKEQIVRFDA